MITKEIISKSLDSAIIKCQPKFESMRTVKQIAKYFHFKYEGVIDNENISDDYYTHYTNGKVHSFIDPNNDNCRIYVAKDLIETKTGNLKSSWYETELPLELQEFPEDWSEEEITEAINDSTYPLKQFFKDYYELPDNMKSSIGELTFLPEDDEIASGRCRVLDEGKCTVMLYKSSISKVGFDNEISSNPRTVLFHEIGHSFSHKLGYLAKEGYDWDTNMSYLAKTKDYKKGRSEDKKLNGDKYATEYAKTSKSFDEEQADITSAMLLKALSKNDPNSKKYIMYLQDGNVEDRLPIDDFLKRYPNRVEALNKYMNLDL